MNDSPLQRRIERRERNKQGLDMNLVSLIDIFTILLFFLLSAATGIETLPLHRAVKLPESAVEATPKPTVVVTVSDKDILVDGRRVAGVDEVLGQQGDLIAGLQAELQHTRAQPGASPTLTIVGDRQLPYRVLRKVMVTCAQADYTDVAFAVRQKFLKTS